MKKDGKYRYTLQFGSESAEFIRAGELLEVLGNKKSTVIVLALNEYLNSHPELLSGHSKIEVKVASTLSKEDMREIARDTLREMLSELQITGNTTDASMSGTSEALEEDIAQMLGNLDMFD